MFLFLTPWIFQFASQPKLAGNAWVNGLVIAIVAIAALTKFGKWEEWINVVSGLWGHDLAMVAALCGEYARDAGTSLWVFVGVIVAPVAAGKLWHLRHTRTREAHGATVGPQRAKAFRFAGDARSKSWAHCPTSH